MLSAILLLMPAVISSQTWSQDQLDNMADTIGVRWKVKDNVKYAGKYLAEVTLTNMAAFNLTREGNWSIYLSCIRMIESDSLPREGGVVLNGQGIRVTHYQGSQFSFQPTEEFISLSPNTTRKIKLSIKYWQVARTSMMPNWYMDVPGLEPRLIQSTVGEDLSFVEGFTKPQEVKRYGFDKYSPFTAQERYRRNHLNNPFDEGETRVIPRPLHMNVEKTSNVTIKAPIWKVYALAGLENEVDYFKDKSGIESGGAELESNVIRMRIGEVVVNGGGIPKSEENYKLTVDPVGGIVEIVGRGKVGVFYGVQTLLSLISQRGGIVYKTEITDSPRYTYRGLHFDVGRNFHSKQEVVRLLGNMAIYKLNTLHLHLSEDEGWRLEIPGLEELTKLGSKRCHDPTERTCLLPQIGSGPYQNTSGSGFYSTTDYREILQEAERLHLHIIPEFDMPGHARAAIKSMEERFRRLEAAGEAAEGRKYLLTEDGDTSEYITPQMFTDNAMNPCMESTYTFIEHVLTELIKLHEDIQPLTLYHFGGDEVGQGAWVNSTACKTRFNSQIVSTSQVKEYFFERVSNMTSTKQINLGGWEDGLAKSGHMMYDRNLARNDEVFVYSWDNVWEAGLSGRAYSAANAGYKVVMSQATHNYFDHPYEPDPEERGYYWATRYTDTHKTFSFTPEHLYSLIDVTRSGETITRAEACGETNESCPPLMKPENIAGLQGCLWGETTRTSEQVESQLFPRILALAERSWHKASWEGETQTEAGRAARQEDWESFAKLIGRFELRRLDTENVKYRVPPPGAIEKNGFLELTTTYPGLFVQYSKDNGKTWYRATNNVLVKPSHTLQLRTMSSDRTRHSRVITFHGSEPLPIVDQSFIDNMAQNITVKYDVIDNFQDGASTFLAQITLTNTGLDPLNKGNWGIYFCSIYMVPDHQPGLQFQHLTVTHLKGCLFKMEPTQDFETLTPDEERKIKVRVENWSVSRTDMMPNWYFYAEGMEGRTIESTKGDNLNFVGDFTTPQQWKRYNTSDLQDRYDPYSPMTRYTMNEDVEDMGASQHSVIPTPVAMAIDNNVVPLDISQIHVIHADNQFTREAQYLNNELSKGGYTAINVTTPSSRSSGYIELVKRDPQVVVDGVISSSEEAYAVTVDPSTHIISIWSSSSHGVFNGIQSLLSLVLKHHRDGLIPKVSIEDAPRFSFRGMFMDVSRNFHSKESVLKMLEVMSHYKLNKLHLHLADDEGWRIQIPGLEELTVVGSKRCNDLDEQACIISQLGSGPDTSTSGSGFYTRDDYREILKFANDRHIEVIPEIDSPGHAHAAIAAMEARRRRLLDLGDLENADVFNLADLEDTSDYLSIQLFKDNAINPCISSTYTFFAHVLQELIEMHKDVNPLKTYHFGGDEVSAGAWLDSPACQSLLNANVSLKEHFSQSMSNLTSQLGLNLAAWEDGLMETANQPFTHSLLSNNDVIANAWDNVWEWGSASRAYHLANAGYKVILSHATHLYFDHPYEPDPEERGYYWATRFADTYKTFGYIATNVYDNVDVRLTGEPMTREELCGEDGKTCVALEHTENIIGMQGHIWSETIRTDDDLYYMVFPRLVALAERAWHKASWEDSLDMGAKRKEWVAFANTLGYQELPALDKMNISYRIPLPGAKISDGRLKINLPLPGLDIVYSTDEGHTWHPGHTDMTPPDANTVHIALRSPDGLRQGRHISLTLPTTPSPVDSASQSHIALPSLCTTCASVLLILCQTIIL